MTISIKGDNVSMAKVIMTIDPGEHIGVLIVHNDAIYGMTLEGDSRNKSLWTMLNENKPDEIIFEQFALRASAAKKLVGNKFVTCEVIGVIKLYVQLNKNVIAHELLPSVKEYCGFGSNPKDPHYKKIKMLRGQKITEHVRDTYRLYRYWKLFGNRFSGKN